LILYDIEISRHVTKDAILHLVFNPEVHLHLEDPGDQFRSVLCSLAGEQLTNDLGPVRVGGKRIEDVGFSVLSTDRHAILEYERQLFKIDFPTK
jgi:hypothetical protein